MKFLKAIAAGLYSVGLHVRHALYDAGVIKSYTADIPVVCVGNITVGGTGKTPTVEYLIDVLSDRYTVAVLSRGYGRRTKGYLEVQSDSSFLNVGDEPKQIKRAFPNVVVVVCEDRTEGIKRICTEHPEVNLIVMDDGFQHRRVTPKVNIILTDYSRQIHEDHLLPLGRLRDLSSQMQRANIILITKTPAEITPIERRIAVKYLKLLPYQKAFFTGVAQGEPESLFPDVEGLVPVARNAVVLAGVGNPTGFVDYVRSKYVLREEWIFNDHHVYKVGELRKLVDKLAALPHDTVILTTSKDAVKLVNRRKVPVELQQRLYKIPMRVSFPEPYEEDAFLAALHENIEHSY